MNLRATLGRSLAQFGLLTWTALAIVPFILIILLSFRSNGDIITSGLGLNGEFTIEGYRAAWTGPSGGGGMSTFFANSMLVSATALTVNLGAGVTAAYFISHVSQKLRAIFLRIVLAATVLPIIILLIPMYQGFNAVGLVNVPVAVGVAYGALGLPGTILICSAAFSDFPHELLEAAAIDGMGPWRSYLTIVIPLSRSIIVAIGILTLINVWGETQLGVVLLQSPDSQTIPLGLLSFQGQFTSNYTAIFAGLAMGTVPIIVVYLIFQRYVTKGIALGGFGGK
ncbi:carbohydrate ABC transporter permease [Ruania alba]|uniref:Raffinose/stachyose/melibiose transport system permease protein n=1 Tax=Ruania alba TaxID=648782 RepID=A0A1H5EYV5_9MICO|nr:carbohydrate ABC transporter permease [Ruania alba]SED96259.1 raffinose/stachyose/melibiose transport system permease protein [Ruania alba]